MAREYKDSGIEWIGQIPKEWEVSKLKYLTTILQSGGTPTSSNASLYCEDGTSWVAIGDMRHCGEISYTQKHLTDEGLKEKSLIVFPVGTLLYSIYASVGKVSILGIPAAINQAILAISLNEKAKQEYVKFVLTSMENYVFSLANGNTQFNLNAGIVSNFVLPLPSLLSQQRIADYLDKICGEVDEMIALQETMIEELKAYKQSVITEAVTKGLNPAVTMRNSGIDWIGEIPEHWEVRRIGRLFRLRDEKNYKPMEEVQLLSLYTGIGVFPHGEQEERGNKAVTVEGYKVVHKDDIVVNIILAWMGAIGVSDYDGVTSPAYDVYIPDFTKVVPHYFHYVFRTKGIAAECYKYGRGIMMMRWRTYSSEFKQISVPYPSIEEQHKIASYLDTKCSEIDSLIALKQAKIEELKEYKKSVIYEYVTGKKEVI